MQPVFSRETPVDYFAVDSPTVINRGDAVWLDSDDVKPASDFTWDTDIFTTRAAFAAKFAGVALGHSASGETSEIPVQVGGFIRFGFAGSTYEVGDPVAMDKASGNAMLNDRLETSSASECTFRVRERGEVQDGGKLLVEIYSAFAGANVNAQVG